MSVSLLFEQGAHRIELAVRWWQVGEDKARRLNSGWEMTQTNGGARATSEDEVTDRTPDIYISLAYGIGSMSTEEHHQK